MICPKCSAETRVLDSRPHKEDARVVVRKRVCEGCGERFKTQEGTIDIVAQRARKRAREAKARAPLTAQERSRLSAERNERRIRQHQREASASHPIP